MLIKSEVEEEYNEVNWRLEELCYDQIAVADEFGKSEILPAVSMVDHPDHEEWRTLIGRVNSLFDLLHYHDWE